MSVFHRQALFFVLMASACIATNAPGWLWAIITGVGVFGMWHCYNLGREDGILEERTINAYLANKIGGPLR